ncbi:hypothetical protein DH86_00002707, partial [Scytalidium sp. 3C]
VCFKLSSAQTTDLPRLVPVLLRHIWSSHDALSKSTGNAAKSDAPKSAILVHELKTRLTALLNGKSPEGRFAAAALIRGVVESGGWGVLQDQKVADNWVPGLLETGPSCIKRVVHLNAHEDLCHDPSISVSCANDHDADPESLCGVLSTANLAEGPGKDPARPTVFGRDCLPFFL